MTRSVNVRVSRAWLQRPMGFEITVALESGPVARGNAVTARVFSQGEFLSFEKK